MLIDLGHTQNIIIDWNQGKLFGLFDGTLPTRDGQMVFIIDQVANENYIRSLIPVLLNDVDTYLLVVFDSDNPKGVVVGATERCNGAGQPERGYDPIMEGDIVIPVFDRLSWDESTGIQNETFYGDTITVGADGSIGFSCDDG